MMIFCSFDAHAISDSNSSICNMEVLKCTLYNAVVTIIIHCMGVPNRLVENAKSIKQRYLQNAQTYLRIHLHM